MYNYVPHRLFRSMITCEVGQSLIRPAAMRVYVLECDDMMFAAELA